MKDIVKKSYSIIIGIAVFAIFFAWTGGAAMALDAAVTHQVFGKVVFSLGIILSILWIIDQISKSYIKCYRIFRKGELGKMVFSISIGSYSIILIIMNIISLVIH